MSDTFEQVATVRQCSNTSISPSLLEDDFVPIMGTSRVRLCQESSLEDQNEQEKETQKSCCHPSSLFNRILALFLMCLLGFGSYFCYDNPGALQNQIKEELDISTYQFENLYAFYSWPNVILPVVGGYLVDNVFGMRIAAFVFAAFILLGQVLMAIGAFYKHFPVMLLSRFVFGIGGESLAVAQNTYASAWFKGNILNFVFGLQTSVARVGSTVNFQVVEPLFNSLTESNNIQMALGWTLLIAGISCFVSLLSASILGLLDKRRENLTQQSLEPVPKVDLRHLLAFPSSFWLISFICVTYYVAVFPFVTLGKVFFEEKYQFSSHNANFITGLVYLMSAGLAPVLGGLIDLIGRNVTFVLLAVLATLSGHITLAFSDFDPYISIVTMGVGYSLLCAALWPMVALIVPLHRQGTAFGLMQAIQNLGLAVISLLVGYIVDNYGYLWVEIFFIFWLVLATILTVTLWFVDKQFHDGFLNMPVSKRKSYEAELAVRAEAEVAALINATGEEMVY